MKRTLGTILAACLVGALAFFVGRATAPSDGNAPSDPGARGAGGGAPSAAEQVELWTCPMHPQVKLPDDVPCPICGMELVPFDPRSGPGPGRVELTAEAAALAGVGTAEAVRAAVERPVRLVGLLARDETTLRTVSANVPGRIERLFVDRVGVEVEAGEHLFEIYSPSLYSAQTELIQVLERIDARGGNEGAFFDETLERNLRSARDKLVLYGLDASQIEAIERSRDANQRVEVRSPVAGTVVARHVEQGDYVMVGEPIFGLAGLTDLWLELEAHEQDLPWLTWGQEVVASFEALPGEVVRGKVSFVDPELDPRTRTVSLRVHVHDDTGRLRPGMFARATVLAELDADGRVVRPDYEGLWVSPMHPEVVSDRPGRCTVCGMDLVPAEELGLSGGGRAGEPLVVPASAVLWTGRRAVAYVEVEGAERPTYALRELTLGPRAGERFVVLEGLEAGERVVVAGAFRLDSEMQIRGEPSMLSMPAEPGPGSGPDGAPFRATLAPAVERYLELQVALAGDDDRAAAAAAAALVEAARAVEPALLPRRARAVGEALVEDLAASAVAAAEAGGIEPRRTAFEPLSGAVRALVERFGAPGAAPLFAMHCPMAFDDAGADWLQRDARLANPYFGASMLRCGEQRASYPPADLGPRPADLEDGPRGRGGPPDATREGGGAAAPGDDASGEGPSDAGGADAAAGDGAQAGGGARERSDADADRAGAGSETAGGPSDRSHAALWEAYLAAAEALAADDGLAARTALDRLAVAAGAVEAEGPEVDAALATLVAALEARGPAPAIDAVRADFEPVSDAARALLDVAGNRAGRTLRVAHCPMAFENRGARWVQGAGELANPYFGASMLRCGRFEREVEPR